MGRVEFRRPWPPLQAPRLCLHGGQEGRAGGTRSLPCLPYRAAAAAAVWTGVAGAEGASQEELPPPAASAAARGGRARSMSATNPVAFSWGRLRPLGGDRRRGPARLWRAAEMRLKTSGSDTGGLAAGEEGGGGGGGAARLGRGGGGGAREPYGAGSAPVGARSSGARGQRPGVVRPGRWWRGERVNVPPTRTYWPLIYQAPRVSQEVKRRVFQGSRVARPQCRGGAGAQRPGGGGGACTGETPGGPRLGGPGRLRGPVQARRTAPPLLRAGPRGRAPGGPARPGAGPSDSAGPPRGQCALRGPPGSSV